MDDEAIYRIRVAGRLGPEWSARLANMSLVVCDEPGHGTATDLTGSVADQASLMAVLSQLYELGATLLAVERRESHDNSITDTCK